MQPKNVFDYLASLSRPSYKLRILKDLKNDNELRLSSKSDNNWNLLESKYLSSLKSNVITEEHPPNPKKVKSTDLITYTKYSEIII